MTVKVLRDQIVVSKETDKETVSPGGILVSIATEKNVAGTVLAVGSGRLLLDGTLVPVEVEVGERVLFNKNTATEVSYKGETVFVLREDQVICVLQ